MAGLWTTILTVIQHYFYDYLIEDNSYNNTITIMMAGAYHPNTWEAKARVLL